MFLQFLQVVLQARVGGIQLLQCVEKRLGIDVVVQVARGAGAARRVLEVVEVVDEPGPFAVRPLLATEQDELVVVARPRRPARRVAR